MQLVNLNNSYFLKQNDTATQIKLGVLDYEGNPFPLDTAEKIEVVIGVEEGRVLVKEASLLSGIGEIEFGLDEGDIVPAGDNRLEVHIYTPNGEKHVVPSKGYYKLRVQKPIDDLDVQVTTYTLDYFLDQVNKITEGLPETVKEAQRLTEQMQMDLDEVAQLKVDAQEAADLSHEARDVANQIIDDMTTVKADAEKATTDANLAATNATNAANNANVAADSANSAAERANNEADYAKLQGDYAKAQGDYAKSQAELIDDILEQGSVVAVNGKTGNVILTAEDVNAIPISEKGVVGGVARLNEEGKVVDANGNEVEGKVKSVNGMIGDVVGLETVEGATQKANQAEVNAKAYTDQQIQLVTETGIPKLVRYEYTLYPTTENQTTFEIPLDIFDVETDSEVVVKNTVTLDPNEDYTIEGKNIVLNEPVPLNTRLTVFIYKNVPIGEEGAINGAVLANGTIAFEKLDEATKDLINNKANRDELIQTNNNLMQLQQDFMSHLADFAVNVKDFGAVGDGINNDQPAIQAAIDYAHANKKNVYIPNGKYRLEDTIKRKGNVSLYGKSMTETELIFAKVSGGVIIDTVNESLHGVTIQDVKLSKENNVAGNVIGILGGSTLELYNSAIGTFRNIQIVGLTHGISGNGVPDGVGIFDCLFENIVISSCFIGLRLHGSGNVVIHPRIVLCDTGVTLEYLNGESFAGVKFVNGVFVQNGYDIGITNVNGIRPSSFNGTWFEQAEHGIINIPYENTKIMSLSFNDCMLNTNNKLELMNFYNALCSIKIDNCTILQVGDSSTKIINPSSTNSNLKVSNTIKILNNGERSYLNYCYGDKWQQLDLLNDWVHVNESSITKYFKTDDNIVHLQIAMKDGVPNGGTIIGTLPDGYRPKQSVRFVVLDATNGVLRHLYVNSNGNIAIQSIPSVTDVTGIWSGYVTFKADL